MKEIKYRGWCENLSKWVYGYIAPLTLTDQPTWIILDFDNASAYVVVKGSIGEYTGCKDACGQEIYEGDYLTYVSQSGKNAAYLVQWYDQTAGWAIFDKDGDWADDFLSADTKYIIIGNAYQNGCFQ